MDSYDSENRRILQFFKVYTIMLLELRNFADLRSKDPNFRRLVLGCMDSYDSEQRRILQHFSQSSRIYKISCPSKKLREE